jgi:NAD(P)H-flavin reductase
MARIPGKVIEIIEAGEDIGLVLGVESKLTFSPGQYFQASETIPSSVLPYVFYPLQRTEKTLSVIPSRKSNWYPDQEISLRGPLGNGFHLPSTVTKVGLVAFGQAKTTSLLPLAETLLAAGKEAALVTDLPVQGLPMALEILPSEQAAEVAGWADALAICALPKDIPELMRVFSKEASRKSVEVFLQTEMPCAGVAACGVCAILTKKGWKHACKEGPVFSLGDLVSE